MIPVPAEVPAADPKGVCWVTLAAIVTTAGWTAATIWAPLNAPWPIGVAGTAVVGVAGTAVVGVASWGVLVLPRRP